MRFPCCTTTRRQRQIQMHTHARWTSLEPSNACRPTPSPVSRLTNIKEPFRPLQPLNVKGVSELHEGNMNDALICWLGPLKCNAYTHTHTHLHRFIRSSSAHGLATSQPVACQSYSLPLEYTHIYLYTNKAVYSLSLSLFLSLFFALKSMLQKH